jgi:hypothetical protein
VGSGGQLVARHRKVRGVLLPATVIVGLLLAATAATYEVVRIHDRTVAAIAAGARASDRVQQPAEPARRPARHRLGRLPNPTALPRPSMPPIPKTATSRAGSTGRGAAGTNEPAQLRELAALLRRSAAIRTLLEATTRAVADCALAPDLGLSRLHQVIQRRGALLSSVAAAAVSEISDGGQLRAELVSALSYSLAADGEFANWMGTISGGACPVPTLSVSSFQAALSDSDLANGAKAEFLRQWNPLAARFGQPEFGTGQI